MTIFQVINISDDKHIAMGSGFNTLLLKIYFIKWLISDNKKTNLYILFYNYLSIQFDWNCCAVS